MIDGLDNWCIATKAKYETLNKLLFIWFCAERKCGLPVQGQLFNKKLSVWIKSCPMKIQIFLPVKFGYTDKKKNSMASATILPQENLFLVSVSTILLNIHSLNGILRVDSLINAITLAVVLTQNAFSFSKDLFVSYKLSLVIMKGFITFIFLFYFFLNRTRLFRDPS